MTQVKKNQHSSLSLLFEAPAVISVCILGEILALALALASPSSSLSRPVLFGLASFSIQWILMGTLASLYTMRNVITHLPLSARLLCSLAISVAVAGAFSWAAITLIPQDLPPASKWNFVLRIMVLAGLLGTLGILIYLEHWRTRGLAVRTKQAELTALQARVDPHFLFNTLNTGVALVHAQPDAAERLLLDLSDLFRAALAGPRMVSLEEELALATRYLEIEQLRFGTRLHVQVDAPRPLTSVQLPALTLQPLVENAIRHGIERRPEGGTLQVTVLDAGNEVRVVVTNPIADAPHAASDHRGHHVGQAAVEARLADMTGGRARLETREEPGRYTATVVISR